MRVADGVFIRKLYFSLTLPQCAVPRVTYATLLVGDKIALVDTGVAYNSADIVQLCAEAGADVKDIDFVINTHCHPDHSGGNRRFKEISPTAKFLASAQAKGPIENPASQFAVRPVPGFDVLVSGPVRVDQLLEDGGEIDLGFPVTVLASPGHSDDSISLFLPRQKLLISGDAIPCPNDVPIYDDLDALERTLDRLQRCRPDHIVSAFAGHIWAGGSRRPFDDSRAYLTDIQAAVEDYEQYYPRGDGNDAQLERARFVLKRLGVESEVLPFIVTSINEHVRRSKPSRPAPGCSQGEPG